MPVGSPLVSLEWDCINFESRLITTSLASIGFIKYAIYKRRSWRITLSLNIPFTRFEWVPFHILLVPRVEVFSISFY